MQRNLMTTYQGSDTMVQHRQKELCRKVWYKIYEKKIGAGLIVILLGFIYYYVALPAVNIHESGFWVFLGDWCC